MDKADFTSRKNLIETVVYAACVLLVVVFAAAPGARAQGDCKTVFDADDKMLTTDHRTILTRTGAIHGGKAETNESVMVGGVSYIQVKGAWRKSPMTLAELREQKTENRKNAKSVSCHYLRDESVDGQAARVFAAHSETEDDKSDVTVWISKDRGLPLRQEQDMDVGGAAGKMHYSIRFEYTNVSAPPVQ
jgi:hypothetical protein